MKLAEIRKERGWSRNELARRSGITPTAIAFIEWGTIKKPKLETLWRICLALGVLPEEVDEFKELAEEYRLTFEAWEKIREGRRMKVKTSNTDEDTIKDSGCQE